MPTRAGVAYVDILPRLDKFQRVLTTRVNRIARRFERSGAALTSSLTLPIAAVGIASGKLALDFDDAMTKIVSLVGISRRQVDAWAKDVLELAKTVPQGPVELAEALYFVTSSGFKGAESLDVLKASARGAAAGLGSTAQVADAVTSAVNAYGLKNLSASEATDILVAAVREGKGEADEFAATIGRVIPLASELGVSFGDVGGALAAMTREGLDAAESTTALRGFLATLIKPSARGTKVLESMGISMTEASAGAAVLETALAGTGISMAKLRAVAASKKGLFPAMLLLKEAIGGNRQALGAIIPNVRALTGFLNVTGKNAKANAEVFRQVRDSVGETDRAFKAASQSAKFRLNVQLSKLKVVGVELGRVVIPVIERFLGGLTRLAEKFTSLPRDTQKSIVKFALLAATLGPALLVAGKLVRLFGSLARLSLGFAKGATVVARAVGAAAFGMKSLKNQALLVQPLLALIAISAAGVAFAMQQIAEGNRKTADSFRKDTIPTFLKTADTLVITAHAWRSGPFGGKDIQRAQKVLDAFGKGAINNVQAFNALTKIAGISQQEIVKVAKGLITTELQGAKTTTQLVKAGLLISNSFLFAGVGAGALADAIFAAGIEGKNLTTILANLPKIAQQSVQAALNTLRSIKEGTFIGPLTPEQAAIRAQGIEEQRRRDKKLAPPEADTRGIEELLGGEKESKRKSLADERKRLLEDLVESFRAIAIPGFRKIFQRSMELAIPAAIAGLQKLHEGLNRLTAAAVEARKKGLVSASVVRRLTAANRASGGFIARLEKLRERLEAFNQKVTAGFEQFLDLSEAFSAGGNIAKILQDFSKRAADAQEFSRLLVEASQRGISQGIIGQAAQAGPQALEFLRALQQLSPEQIRQLNEQQRAIDQARIATIQALDKKFFGPAFTALSKQVQKFAASLDGFINALRKIIKKLVPGVKLATGGIATGPVPALVGEAGPEAIIPLDRLDDMLRGSRDAVVVKIYPKNLISTKEELIRDVRDALLALRRRNGAVGLA